MSEKYRLVRVGDLCISISGLWTGKKAPFEKATVIRNTNFTKDCKLDLTNVAILDVETRQLQTRKLIAGDLIVEKSGGGPNQPVGRVVYFNEPEGVYSLSNFTSALRLKDSSEALPRYLQHFLYYQYVSGVTETMQSNSTGIRNLNIHQFLDIKVPLPSLDEQRKIVENLDSAFTEIDLLEVNLGLGDEKTNQLLQSLLSSAFSTSADENDLSNNSLDKTNATKLVPLGDVCTIINGGTPDTKNSKFWDGKHAWITPAEMGKLKSPYLAGSKRTLTDEGLSNSSAQLVPKYSVIMSSRAPIGHLVINEIPMASNQGCKGMIPNKNLNHKYLYYFLYANKQYLNELGSGTTFAEISGSKLKTVLIPLPSLEKQSDVVNKLDNAFTEIESLKAQIRIEKDYAFALRQSLLSSAFTREEAVA